MKTFRKHFDTITEMADYDRNNHIRGAGFGRASADTLQRFRSGDESYISEVELYLEKINDALPETMREEWHSDVFGPVISVPDYLSSSPVPFRRERMIESSSAPVRILVSLTSSGALSHQVLRDRGIVILALLMKVQQVRPVDLVVYCELDCDGCSKGIGIVSLNIESKPLSIGHALNVLSDSHVARNIFYSTAKNESEIRGMRGVSGSWPEGFSYGGSNVKYYDTVKKFFDMGDGDLYIPPTYVTDPIVTNPLGWINENLQKMVHFEE